MPALQRRAWLRGLQRGGGWGGHAVVQFLEVQCVVAVARAGPLLVRVHDAGALVAQPGVVFGDEQVTGQDVQRVVRVAAVGVGQPLRANRLPGRVVDHRGRVVDVGHDAPDQRVAGPAGEIAGCDQAGPGDLAFPAGEGLALQQAVVQRSHADAVGVDDEATFGVEDLPAHHVGHAVEFVLQHGLHVGGVDPWALDQIVVAPQLDLPARVVPGPGLDAVVRALAVVADPDDVECLGNHGAGLLACGAGPGPRRVVQREVADKV